MLHVLSEGSEARHIMLSTTQWAASLLVDLDLKNKASLNRYIDCVGCLPARRNHDVEASRASQRLWQRADIHLILSRETRRRPGV